MEALLFCLVLSLNDAARNLENPKFAEREAATKALIEGGGKSIPILSAIAKTGNLETAVRCVTILETIYTSPNSSGSTIDLAEFALDDMRDNGRPEVADRATIILEMNKELSEKRGLEEVKKYNAIHDHNNHILVIPATWKGGDKGIKQVARIKSLAQLIHTKKAKLSETALNDLKRAMPDLMIQLRGEAKLGVTTVDADTSKGCRISPVAGGPAENGGLQALDAIIKIDKIEIKNFADVVSEIGKHDPGDVVEITVIRWPSDQEMKFKVTLAGWQAAPS